MTNAFYVILNNSEESQKNSSFAEFTLRLFASLRVTIEGLRMTQGKA